MSALPMRQAGSGGQANPSRQGSGIYSDVRNEIHPHQSHYIGIDVGTGSARACIINEAGDIVGLASENIGLWQPQTGYYVWPPKRKQRAQSDKFRNNQRLTFGAAYATASSEPSLKITSIPPPSAASASMLPAPLLSSHMTPMSLSRSQDQTSTSPATTTTSYSGLTTDPMKRRRRSTPQNTTCCGMLEGPCPLRWRYPKSYG